jgi:hypothetical protein
MHFVGFPNHPFCTIILQIGRRSIAFAGKIILSLDWFLVWEMYVNPIYILRNPYFMIHRPADGCSVVRHYIC